MRSRNTESETLPYIDFGQRVEQSGTNADPLIVGQCYQSAYPIPACESPLRKQGTKGRRLALP